MNLRTIESRARQTMARVLGVAVSALNDDKTLAKHGADSLDRVEMVIELETDMNIIIDDSEAQRLDDRPVREWLQFVEARVAANAS